MLIQGGTHLHAGSEASGEGAWAIPAELASPDPTLARQYLKASSLAFMQTYVNAQDEYRAYLTASYAQAISQSLLRLVLVRTLSLGQL